jgi:hypothetical protein
LADIIQFPSGEEDLVALVIDEVGEKPIAVENVLNGALEAGLTEVTILGRQPDGEFYLASSSNNISKLIYYFEIAKLRIISDGQD